MSSMDKMIDRLRSHPESNRIGMIACHFGVVRGTSLKGFQVQAVEVFYDQDAIDKITNEIRDIDGIVDVLVETSEGLLKVGDEIMAVAVAGETRETVFPALMNIVDRIKAEAVRKSEIPL